jgi:hypothetical protein
MELKRLSMTYEVDSRNWRLPPVESMLYYILQGTPMAARAALIRQWFFDGTLTANACDMLGSDFRIGLGYANGG